MLYELTDGKLGQAGRVGAELPVSRSCGRAVVRSRDHADLGCCCVRSCLSSSRCGSLLQCKNGLDGSSLATGDTRLPPGGLDAADCCFHFVTMIIRLCLPPLPFLASFQYSPVPFPFLDNAPFNTPLSPRLSRPRPRPLHDFLSALLLSRVISDQRDTICLATFRILACPPMSPLTPHRQKKRKRLQKRPSECGARWQICLARERATRRASAQSGRSTWSGCIRRGFSRMGQWT